jgi:hypothetical protein
VNLAEMFAKIPGVIFTYPEFFIGLSCVIFGLPKGVDPSNAFLPFGFALIAVSRVRRNFSQVGFWREETDNLKLHFAFKEFFASLFWCAVSWGCLRWWALDVQLNEPMVRRILQY